VVRHSARSKLNPADRSEQSHVRARQALNLGSFTHDMVSYLRKRIGETAIFGHMWHCLRDDAGVAGPPTFSGRPRTATPGRISAVFLGVQVAVEGS
jgi:hypothetical protein